MVSQSKVSVVLQSAPTVLGGLIRVRIPPAVLVGGPGVTGPPKFCIDEDVHKSFKYHSATDNEADDIALYIALTAVSYVEALVSIGTDDRVFTSVYGDVDPRADFALYHTLVPVRVLRFLACQRDGDNFSEYSFTFTRRHLELLQTGILQKMRHFQKDFTNVNQYFQAEKALFGAAIDQQGDARVPWDRMCTIAESWHSIQLHRELRGCMSSCTSSTEFLFHGNEWATDAFGRKGRGGSRIGMSVRGRGGSTRRYGRGGRRPHSDYYSFGYSSGYSGRPHSKYTQWGWYGCGGYGWGGLGQSQTQARLDVRLMPYDVVRAPELTYRRNRELITVCVKDGAVYMKSKQMPRAALRLLTSYSLKLGALGEFGIMPSTPRGTDNGIQGLNELISDVNNGHRVAANWLLSHVLTGRIVGSDARGSKTSWFPLRCETGEFVYERLLLRRMVDTIGPLVKNSHGQVLLPVYGRMKVCVLTNLDQREVSVEWREPNFDDHYEEHLGLINEIATIGG